MPLVTALFLGYVTGLLLGFGRVESLVVGVCVLALAVAGVRRRRASPPLVALALLFAWMVARDAAAEDAVCRRLIQSRGETTAALLTPLRSGRAGTARTTGECHLRIRISTRREALEPGTVVRVRGTFARAGTALTVRNAEVMVIGRPSALARARNAIGRFLDREYERDAAMARALV